MKTKYVLGSGTGGYRLVLDNVIGMRIVQNSVFFCDTVCVHPCVITPGSTWLRQTSHCVIQN